MSAIASGMRLTFLIAGALTMAAFAVAVFGRTGIGQRLSAVSLTGTARGMVVNCPKPWPSRRSNYGSVVQIHSRCETEGKRQEQRLAPEQDPTDLRSAFQKPDERA